MLSPRSPVSNVGRFRLLFGYYLSKTVGVSLSAAGKEKAKKSGGDDALDHVWAVRRHLRPASAVPIVTNGGTE